MNYGTGTDNNIKNYAMNEFKEGIQVKKCYQYRRKIFDAAVLHYLHTIPPNCQIILGKSYISWN